MRNKLICYVNSIFEGIPDAPELQELREEILQNTLDRYDEECARGVSETVAYNVAVMSIGDTDELLAAYRKPKKEKKALAASAWRSPLCCISCASCRPPLQMRWAGRRRWE